MRLRTVAGILLTAGIVLTSCGAELPAEEKTNAPAAAVTRDENGWVKEGLTKVETDSSNADEVTIDDPHRTEERLRVMIENNGSRELRFRAEEELHVKLDGEWYAVPYLPGTVLGDTILPLSPGKKEPVYCDLNGDFGELPSGDYRIGVQVIWIAEKEAGESPGYYVPPESEKFSVYYEFTLE